ncbi:hypothetical protein AVL50_31805 [Flammeovirga sp. SJP92]|nr:hypothetical protein AVL50_31805 [Flammeovirga sp. SJP92]
MGASAGTGILYRYRGGKYQPVKKEFPDDGYNQKLIYTGMFISEFYLQKNTIGNRDWEHIYNYPSIGFKFTYADYSVPDELGKSYAVTTYLEYTLSKKRKHKFTFSAATGLSYIEKKFDLETNPFNYAISNHWNFCLDPTFSYHRTIYGQWDFVGSFGIRHLSNGHRSVPNNGMNNFVFTVGVRHCSGYERKTISKEERKKALEALPRKRPWHFSIVASKADRKVLQIDRSHQIRLLQASVYKQVGNLGGVILNYDYFEYTQDALWKDLRVLDHHTKIKPETIDPVKMGLSLGYAFNFGKSVEFSLSLGHYIYDPQPIEGQVYTRYSLRYFLLKRIIIHTGLKAKGAASVLADFGLGVRI